MLVQNQAQLDQLIIDNQKRQEHIDRLLTEIAYLDSPEGVAVHAVGAGLVAAAEVVTLTPVVPGALLRPSDDPFGLADLPPVLDTEYVVATADDDEGNATNQSSTGRSPHGDSVSSGADARYAVSEGG